MLTEDLRFKNPDDWLGHKLGKYLIQEKLGSGGKGVVFKVLDTLEDRPKAIKIIPPQIAGSSVAFMDLKREVNVSADIIHPNVVKVTGLEYHEGQYFIVMEYVEGISLEQKLADSPGGKLNEAEVIEIMKMLAQGLLEVHNKKVIHRDIKPSNIMITPRGMIKILDFGISYQITKSMTQLVSDLGKTGTWLYMAPEQLSTQYGRDDKQVDIWGFGVMIYQLLSGELPFSYKDQIKDIKEKPFILKGVSKNLYKIVMRCLEKDRSKRFKDFSEVLRSLDELSNQEEIFQPIDSNTKAEPNVGVDEKKAFGPKGPKNQQPSIKDQVPPPKTSPLQEKKYKSKPSENKRLVIRPSKRWLWIIASLTVVISLTIGLSQINWNPTPASGDKGSTKVNQLGPEEEDINRHNVFLEKAKDDLKKEDYKEARKNINLSKGIKETKETRDIENQINEGEQKENDFSNYLYSARKAYDNKNYDEALTSIVEAKKIKVTIDLEELEKTVVQAKEEDRIKLDDIRFRGFVVNAKDYLIKKDIPKARSNINLAKGIKQTRETFDIEDQINELERKENKFTSYLSKAKTDYDNKQYDGALENISKAKQIKVTKDLEDLESNVLQDKKDDRNNRLAKQDQSDWDTAQKRGTNFSYNKYLILHPYGKYKSRAREKIKNLENLPNYPVEIEKVVKKIGKEKVVKNPKGYWEADYGDGIIMVYIPAGNLTMGSDEGRSNEKPVHRVYLDGYWMGKYEVTINQYMKFVNESKTHYPEWLEKGNVYNINKGSKDYYKKHVSDKNCPIVGVSWRNAKAYCDWLSKKIGLKFKLPTEAQWEKAARGTQGRIYPWGNEFDKKLCNSSEGGPGQTTPVGTYPDGASLYGLLDMAGNVWEWCYDWYDEDYYKNSPAKNPQGPDSGSYRVVRGGSWISDSSDVRCTFRINFTPGNRGDYCGFRLSQDL